MSHTIPAPPYNDDKRGAGQPSREHGANNGNLPPPPNPGNAKRPWYGKRRILLPVTAFVALLFGVAIGSGDGMVTAAEVEEAVSERDVAVADADEAREMAAEADARADDAIADARADMEEELAAAEEELSGQIAEREQELQVLAAQLDERSAALDQREAAVNQQEEIKARNEFASGTYEVGVDIDPGQYRTNAPSGCYWARLGSDGQSINDNHIQSEPGQTVAVVQPSDGFFETSGCGTWQRQG